MWIDGIHSRREEACPWFLDDGIHFLGMLGESHPLFHDRAEKEVLQLRVKLESVVAVGALAVSLDVVARQHFQAFRANQVVGGESQFVFHHTIYDKPTLADVPPAGGRTWKEM
jgi:hypothetical protein